MKITMRTVSEADCTCMPAAGLGPSFRLGSTTTAACGWLSPMTSRGHSENLAWLGSPCVCWLLVHKLGHPQDQVHDFLEHGTKKISQMFPAVIKEMWYTVHGTVCRCPPTTTVTVPPQDNVLLCLRMRATQLMQKLFWQNLGQQLVSCDLIVL